MDRQFACHYNYLRVPILQLKKAVVWHMLDIVREPPISSESCLHIQMHMYDGSSDI